MANEEEFAPYAPATTVVLVIKKFRERGLPEPLTRAALEQVGVSPSTCAPTHQALRFLRLIDEEGNRTRLFEQLRRATTGEYQNQLAEIVRAAYAPIFTIVDPSQDNDIALGDAFRRYDPAKQRNKMISLFRSLCEEAGIVEERPKRLRSTPAPKSSGGKRSTGGTNGAEYTPTAAAPTNYPLAQAHDASYTGLISAVVQQLPGERRWSAERRERWLKAMTAAVDLIFDIDNDDTSNGDQPTAE